ncbi:hypothetical protein A3K63_04245 [Candidatus Micrarchaeota archaeon RBG_16_49_10]|nr:MAG: hypothetical protein A3K63_04245 [Candidatus Micrarchaeota archaeon RBG_16_49_10]
MKKKYKVLLLAAPSGHMPHAKAVKSYLEDIPNTEFKFIDLVGDQFEWDIFRLFYRFLPSPQKFWFEMSKNPSIQKRIRGYFDMRVRKKLITVLKREKPDLVINVYFGYLPVLDEIKPFSKFRLINIVTDPMTIHPILFSSEADFNIGFGKNCDRLRRELKIPKERVVCKGWITSKSFFKDHDAKKIRKALRLEDKLTFLYCGGSEGSGAIVSLLPTLFFEKFSKDIQIIFITGKNKALKKIIHRAYKMSSIMNPHLPKIVLKGFTDRMDEFMAASDVVMGKAGPNMIFESVASRKPFIAITHNANEEGNLDLIRNFGIGWVAERRKTASGLIKKIAKTPEVLKAKGDSLSKLAKLNYETGLYLRSVVLKWIGKSKTQ